MLVLRTCELVVEDFVALLEIAKELAVSFEVICHLVLGFLN